MSEVTQNNITRSEHPGNQFARLLTSFFWDLRSYGFSLSMMEMESAIRAISDVTDVEDVLYTTQSALCHNKEQADTYQALFCQKFLGYNVFVTSKPSAPQNDKGKSGGVDAEEKAIEKRIRKMQQELERIQTSIENEPPKDEYERARVRAGREAYEAQKVADSAKDEAEKAERTYDAARQNALGNQLGEDGQERLDAMLETLKVLPGCESLCGQVEKAVQSASVKDLETAQKDTMRHAAAHRAKGKAAAAEYMQLIKLAAELQKIIAVLRKRNLKTTNGEMLPALKKAYEESAKKYDVASAEYQKAQEAQHKAQAAIDASVGRMRSWKRQAEELKKKLEKETERHEKLRTRQAEVDVVAAPSQLIVGSASVNHREAFIGGHNAVQRAGATTALLNEDIEQLSKDDLQKVSAYIHSNAIFFKQTLRKIGIAKNRNRIDMKRTMEMAMRADGEIARLCYEKSRRSKAKVVLLADISGSCRKSTSLTLTFLSLMGDAFPGGCKQFVFVNRLVPVDKYFRENGVEEAVETINHVVQSRGIYSNYGIPIAQLANDYRGLIGHDTTVLILGDCRNNKNSPSLNEMQWLCSHSRGVYLLVTEGRNEWGTADSVVPQYINCGANACSIQSTNELLDFLQHCGTK